MKWEGISKLKQRPVFDYTLKGLFWGCWHTLWPLANWLCIKNNFWLMYKWQQPINQGTRRGYFNTTKILQCKGNLEFPKLCIWLDKVIGTTQNLQLSLPYQEHFKYSADFKGIVLNPQWNLEEFGSNFQHFRNHYEYFANKLLLTSQDFFNLVLCFAKRAPCYFSFITVLESRCPWRIFYNFFFIISHFTHNL